MKNPMSVVSEFSVDDPIYRLNRRKRGKLREFIVQLWFAVFQ